ncbi:MAG: hypothetical protein LBR18_07860 [Tannerella sp.]|nr:hypothetical protein [Tannerella sp.]
MKKYFLLLTLCFPFGLLQAQGTTETLLSLSQKFSAPTDEYRPYALWQWMGTNFSKEGITKDLEAMNEAGIGGAYIFHVGARTNSKWATQTYRSEAWWDALRHAAAEAKRLGMHIGMHNTPGYTVTGGEWISEEQGMQKVVSTKKRVSGGKMVRETLDKPAPVQGDARKSTFYRDIAVCAVPIKINPSVGEVLDISQYMDDKGQIEWQAPTGDWLLVRLGHSPTMKQPHPLPAELWGKALEVDKMSRKHNIHHWQQVLNPLVERLKEYIGNSFTFVAADSYEAGGQDWTETFRSDFLRLKGYDPLPWLALRTAIDNDATQREDVKLFEQDNKDVISRLMLDNGWKTAAEMLHAVGLQFYWEPYGGPFDTYEAAGVPDLPMVEVWTGGINNDAIMKKAIREMNAHGQRIIGVEAFTGRPDYSKYTEDPAFLKHCADSIFLLGGNRLFLHHWVHQPFDDRYQPGADFFAWGTHFGRHQTWFKPAKAFFAYLARCQMLLQQGACIETHPDRLHRRTPEAEIFFVRNPLNTAVERTFAFPVKNRIPELWDAYWGAIRQTSKWQARGDSVFVRLQLQPDASMFVVFPTIENAYAKLPEIEIVNSKTEEIKGAWEVTFLPKLDAPFKRNMPQLLDFSKQDDEALKYFAGTAVYQRYIRISAADLKPNKRVLLDLGELHDIAEVEINGNPVTVLWHPPYSVDITPCLKAGNNQIRISVTTNWANRLIGDMQEPLDFEVAKDELFKGVLVGRPMSEYPDWFLNDTPRPSKGRKTFNLHYYYYQDSPLQPAGLLGPVTIVKQTVK